MCFSCACSVYVTWLPSCIFLPFFWFPEHHLQTWARAFPGKHVFVPCIFELSFFLLHPSVSCDCIGEHLWKLFLESCSKYNMECMIVTVRNFGTKQDTLDACCWPRSSHESMLGVVLHRSTYWQVIPAWHSCFSQCWNRTFLAAGNTKALTAKQTLCLLNAAFIEL